MCRLHGAANVVVASIYRPGSAVVRPTHFAGLTTFLEALATYRLSVVPICDFNVHLEKVGNADATNLKICWHRLTCASMFRMQHTHTVGGWFDLVFSQSEVKVTGPLILNISFSDHCLVTCQLLVNLPDVDPVPVEGRKWKAFSAESFKSDLSKTAPCAGKKNWYLYGSRKNRRPKWPDIFPGAQ